MDETKQAKVDKPATNFETPSEVVADPALSKQEKGKALETLQQDALQLAVASSEGMGGGEPTNLQEVLDAKNTLETSPAGDAYGVVLRDLKTRQAASPSDGMRALIDHAIKAMEALERAKVASTSTTAGNVPADADSEIAMETEMEKLDP